MRTKISAALIIIMLLLTSCSNAKALESAKEAVNAYNTAVEAYNEKITEFNEAASKVNEKNAMLQNLLDTTQEVINKGEPPFDENTLTELKSAMSEAAGAKKSDVDEVEPIDLLLIDEEAKSKELKELEEKAIAAEEDIKNRVVPEVPEIPDYSDVYNALQDKKTAYENSIQGMKQVTSPTDEFVMERLQRIETITRMDAVSEDHDPNGQLNKQGGYIGCVYFEDTQVDRSQLYIEDGKDNVIDVGTKGGGAVEIFRTAEEAKQRDTYLGAFDGGMLASGSHYVVGTCLVRTSSELTGTQQLELTEKITEALIAVDSDHPSSAKDSAQTDESAQNEEPESTNVETEIDEESEAGEEPDADEESAVDEKSEADAEPEADETESKAVYYSTNGEDTVRNGNEGVYAYIKKGPQYDQYYIIDLDEGYTYYFTDGNGEETCEKVEIESGDLNTSVVITYHDGGDEWSYSLRFKAKNAPDVMILKDNDGFEYEFTPTNLDEALSKRAEKEIREY